MLRRWAWTPTLLVTIALAVALLANVKSAREFDLALAEQEQEHEARIERMDVQWHQKVLAWCADSVAEYLLSSGVPMSRVQDLRVQIIAGCEEEWQAHLKEWEKHIDPSY